MISWDENKPNPHIPDGAIMRISTTGGTIQAIDRKNQDWQRFTWDWPQHPEDSN